MKKVETKYLESWLADNYPNAESKLSVQSGISASLIHKMRYGQAPKRLQLRLRISKVLGITEDELFPPINNVNSAS